ncbi:hypothetical protein AAVH_34106, partial [Aphelenchoides avenae]
MVFLCCVLYAASNLKVVSMGPNVLLYVLLLLTAMFFTLMGILLSLFCENQCLHRCSMVFEAIYIMMATIVLVAWVGKIVAVLVGYNEDYDEELSSSSACNNQIHRGTLSFSSAF